MNKFNWPSFMSGFFVALIIATIIFGFVIEDMWNGMVVLFECPHWIF